MSKPLLRLEGVTVTFGGLVAANDVHLEVHRDKICAVIGPNGAGKTTVFNCVTGIYAPSEGKIHIGEKDIRAPLDGKVILLTGVTAISVALFLVLAINIQTLWDTAINQRFIWGQPFNWNLVPGDIWNALFSLPSSRTFLPSIFGCIIGALGYITTWHRGRHTPYTSVKQGIARTFQNIRIFKGMSVEDNVLVGMHGYNPPSYLAVLFGLPKYRKDEQARAAGTHELLNFVGLLDNKNDLAASLPYGHQRKLEIARALATRPDILLLDEPAAGMNPSEMEELAELIGRIRASGVTVLLIEHHMKLVMGISDHVTVLEYGRKISEGSPTQVQKDPKVIAAYLGDTYDGE